MIDIASMKKGPLVTLIICTYNRPRYFAEALGSAVAQTWRNLQIIVVNDGGEDVSGVVDSVNDPRVELIQRKENRGYAASLNEALGYARGKYVAYLGDDDIHYPNHIASLAGALEGPTDCQAAYSNLYRTMFRPQPDGSRVAIGKVLEIRRDFDRFFMFYFNQALGGSLMHRRELLDRTGPYNEKVKVLIDWDMTRRLSFFTDLLHVYDITGEYCICEQRASDRISYRLRRDMKEFQTHYLTIRTARPAKPWPKVDDLSIIVPIDHLHPGALDVVVKIIQKTFWPFLVYLALPREDVPKLNIREVANLVVPVPVARDAPYAAKVDAALRVCEGEYVALAPPGVQVEDLWVEHPLYALGASGLPRQAYALPCGSPGTWAGVLRTEELVAARRAHPALTVRRSVEAAGIKLLRPTHETNPLVMDDLLGTIKMLETNGDWHHAGMIYEKMPHLCRNDWWMKDRAAQALFRKGSRDAEALELCQEVNQQHPSVDSLLLEAKIRRRMDQTEEAVTLLEQAREVLQWKA